MYVILNGKLVQAREARVSVFDHGFLYGDGVYDTMRTYGGKVWGVENHIKRFEKSANLIGLKLPFPHKKIVQLVNRLIKKNGFKESRIRMTLTRGKNSYDFGVATNPTLLIHAVPLKMVPKKVYKEGVKAVTVNLERVMPQAKTISLLPLVLANRLKGKNKAYEAIYVSDNGYVREGTITNIFIIKGGVLMTPKSKILLGTTRSIILKLAKSAGLKTKVFDFKTDKLYNADEIFISNTVKKIIPVKKVDQHVIGAGKPGSFTKQLMQAFDEYIQKNIG